MFNKMNHPTLAWFLDHWAAAIFVPTILLGLVALALITRLWDERDDEARRERPQDAGPAVTPTPPAHEIEPAHEMEPAHEPEPVHEPEPAPAEVP